MNGTGDGWPAAPAERTRISSRRAPLHPILTAILVLFGTIVGFVLAVVIALLTGIIAIAC